MSRLLELEEQIFDLAGTRFSILNIGQQAEIFATLPPDQRNQFTRLITLYRRELRAAGKRALAVDYSFVKKEKQEDKR